MSETGVHSVTALTDSVKWAILVHFNWVIKRTVLYNSFSYGLDNTLVVFYVCMLCVQPGIERCVVYLMSIISLLHSIQTENHDLKYEVKIFILVWSCRFSGKRHWWSILVGTMMFWKMHVSKNQDCHNLYTFLFLNSTSSWFQHVVVRMYGFCLVV